MSVRRPFDASFSRRPGATTHSQQGSLMGEPPMYSASSAVSRGGGGQRQQYRPSDEDDQEDMLYQSAVAVDRRGGGGQERYDPEDEYEYEQQRSNYQGHGSSSKSTTADGAGGWRQRSPSPRYANSNNYGEFADTPRVNRTPSWTTTSSRFDDQPQSGRQSQNQRQMRQQQQQDQFQSQQSLVGFGGGGALQQNIFSTPNAAASIMRNQNAGGLMGQPVNVMVVPSTPGAGGLMGLNANPFGVIGQQPVLINNIPAFNTAPFAQQLIQQQQQQSSTPFSHGMASQQSSIYGPQTQQAFNRFDSSRNLISSADNNNRRSRNNDRGDRRSDTRKSTGGGQGQGQQRSESDSRKRNLVLRDPRPEEGKKPRMSEGNNRNKSQQQRGGSPTRVKRISVGGGPGGGGGNRNQHQRKKSDNKDNKAKETGVKKEEDDKTKEKDDKTKDKKEEKEKSKKYDGLPPSLLVCKVCQKSMNDGQSFESHLSGRAHQSLMKILEERFAKRAELLMNESKCMEDEINIEHERQRRAGNKNSTGVRTDKNNYCKMCDCKYSQNWGNHKVSLGHRVLKEFLHPTCQFCKSQFMHRRDWVIHLLSPAHMKRLHEIKQEGSMVLDEQESPFQDELFAINMKLSREERYANAITVKSLDGKESLTEEMKEILKNDRGEIELPEGEIPIPSKYEENVTIGMESIIGVNGSRCRVCRVYIADNADIETHCKSKEHFTMYVSFLKRVMRHREHKEQEKKSAEEKIKKEEERKKQTEEDDKKKEGDEVKENGDTGDVKVEDGDAANENMDEADEDGNQVVDEVDGEDEDITAGEDENATAGEDDAVILEDDQQEEEIETAEGAEVGDDDVVMVEETVKTPEPEVIDIKEEVKEEEEEQEVKGTTDEIKVEKKEELLEKVDGDVLEAAAKAPTTAAATTGQTARRGGRPTVAVRGAGGRGGSNQAFKNVPAKVNTNLRGGTATRGRGGRARSPRGGGRGRGGR